MRFYLKKFNRLILKGYILILLFIFLFPINNSFAAMVTYNQSVSVEQSINALISGIHFNKDGTKMFTTYNKRLGGDDTRFIQEYELSTPFDISTRVSTGDSERCKLTGVTQNAGYYIYDLEFSNDGMKLFVAQSATSNNASSGDIVTGFNLTSPYDVSTCVFASKTSALDFTSRTFGSYAGNHHPTQANRKFHEVRGVEINDDGTKLFLIFSNEHVNSANEDVGAHLYEYTLTTPYDVSTLVLNKNAGIKLLDNISGANDPQAMRFTPDGKRIVIITHSNDRSSNSVPGISQISLNNAFDTSSFTLDGGINLSTGLNTSNAHPGGVTFSENGLKLYIGNDNNTGTDEVMEYDLACPFNIIAGTCPEIDENKDRIAMAEAKIELAKRTMDYSTKSVLNRLKWVRRHKEKQNLTNLNMNFHFSDPKFNILSEALKSNVKQISTRTSKKNNKELFYWSEGSVSFGRDGETSLSLHKDINVTSITYGVDKITKNKGLEGIAFRFGLDNVDVGSNGSKIDSHTYNFTYYRTFQRDNETSFLDTIIGIGLIDSDITSIIGNLEFLNKNRLGKQIYMTIKSSDHIERDGYTVVPAAQFDLGHTKFDAYQERQLNGDGSGGVRFEDQNITSGNMRASLGYFKDLKDEKYIVKSRAKIEYQTEFLIKPDIEYSYISDPSIKYSTDLSPNNGDGLNHIINAEIGLDANIGPYELFVIYEQNRKLNYGYVHNFYVSIGHLPENGTKTSYSIKGSENLITNLNIEKNIENILLSFYLENELENPFTYQQANINLKTTF